MPYIGNELATQFQAFVTQTITGDGSTGYTLSRAVANGKELLVYINNVKQEEGSGKAYTATGTTITFSDAVASSDSCYVVFLGSAIQTVKPPDASVGSAQITNATLVMPNKLDMNGNELILDADADTSITADTDDQIDIKIAGSDSLRIKANEIENVSGDFTLDVVGDISLDYGGGQLRLKDDGTEFANIENNNSDLKIVSIVQDKDIIFRGNDGGSYIDAMTIDMSAGGQVVKSLQCYFHVTPSSTLSNITAGGADNDVAFGTETKDIGGNFASSTFTAPVTGTYFLYSQLRLDNIDTAANYYDMKIQTSNRNYRWIENFNTDGGDYTYYSPQVTAIADMDAGDTATVHVLQNGGTQQTDVDADPSRTYFMGYLLG